MINSLAVGKGGIMISVSSVVNSAKQPKGGYIPIDSLETLYFKDCNTLNSYENISPSTVGTVVDYISRFLLGATLKEAFKIPLKGAKKLQRISEARDILKEITGNNNESIIAAVRLIPYDVAFRTGNSIYIFQEPILPNEDTVDNIKIMIDRTVSFFNKYGPITLMGFTFPKASSLLISSGDGDYLTKTGLWDLKVSKNEPNTKQTLQILIYYLMGITSTHIEFGSIDSIGMFNPRLNKAYKIDIDQIARAVLEEVYSDVILYDIRKECAYEYIQELREMKKLESAVIDFKELTKKKIPVPYDVCLNAVDYDYRLLKDVPVEYRDAKLCTIALEFHCYEDEYNDYSSDSSVDIVKYIDDYLKLIPDSSYNENICVSIMGLAGDDKDRFRRIPTRFMTQEFMAYLVYCNNKYYDIVPNDLKDIIFYKMLSNMEVERLMQSPEHLEDMNKEIIVPEIIPINVLEYALIQRPRMIKYVPKSYCGYSELALLAVKQDWKAIKDIPNMYRNDEMFQVVEAARDDKASEWLKKVKTKIKKSEII